MCNTLKECNAAISTLNLSDNMFDDGCMKELGEYLQDNQHLERLHLKFNKIGDKTIDILLEHLVGNMALKDLNLGENGDITNKSVPLLIEIAKKSCILDLNIYGSSISSEHIADIITEIQIPIDKRALPLKSASKSAAKIISR